MRSFSFALGPLALAALIGAGLLIGCGGGSEEANLQRVLAAASQGFTGHGTWWDPAAPGTGWVFEAQGDTGSVAFFVYDDNGKPVWYSGTGPFKATADGRYEFSGSVYRYAGGQSARSTVPKTPTRTLVGDVRITFAGNKAAGVVAGRSFVGEKFNPLPGARASVVQPEPGIYWNPAEGGRGFSIDAFGDMVWIAVFHYEDGGAPTWNLVVGDNSRGGFSADFTSYAGGQTLTGPYKAPALQPADGKFGATFPLSCEGSVQFPHLPLIPIKRFPLGSLPAGQECRSRPAVVDAPPAVSNSTAPVTADAGTGGDAAGGDSAGVGVGSAAGDGVTCPACLDGTIIISPGPIGTFITP